MLDTPESKRRKVAALNLFHPTASPLFEEAGFFILGHSLSRGRARAGRCPICDGPRDFMAG